MDEVREVIAAYDAEHPYWRQEARERREREAKESGERAQRAREARHQSEQQQRAANNSEAWCRWVDQRIGQHLKQQYDLLRDALGMVISDERAARRKEIEAAVKEAQRANDAKLEALEQRLKAVPGKLPAAKTWQPQSVTYQAEFVVHEGALYQARKDTAQAPGGSDWTCVARAGRDALTPTIRGTYNVDEHYKILDFVAMDGGSFIAKYDNPGICPGDGWQLLSRQGKRGQRGERGERGPTGPKGDQGPPVMPQLVSTKIDEFFNLSVLRSDGSLEIIPLREAFDRYHSEINK